MRCVEIHGFGNPADVVTAGERPVPEPGPGEARVRLVLSPIHNHDLAIIRGVYGYKPALPAVPGTEALGVIEALGEGVRHLSLGQRVMTASAQHTWAESFVSPAAKLVPAPAGLADEAACQLLAMPMSALMLLEDLRVQRGQWIVQNAANGAVGKTLAVLAAQRGIGVVNLVRRRKALDDLASAGIGGGVATDDPAWRDAVRALTGGAPIVRAIDSIGGEASQRLMSLLADADGELIVFGSLTFEPVVVSGGDLIFKQALVKGYWASRRFAATPPAELARLIGELAAQAQAGTLPLPVGGIHALSAARAAMLAAEQPGRRGKVLLRPD